MNVRPQAVIRRSTLIESELQGCHAGLLGLLAFSIHHKLQGGTVAFGFDNDAGVNKAATGNLNVSTRFKHADLKCAI